MPVLVAVRDEDAAAWHCFHGGLAGDVAGDVGAILDWCVGALHRSGIRE